jgi:O-acetyl-ADP-ribose deacetylase (regulator of RNase III)
VEIEIVKGDITNQCVDVIVNAAKSSLLGGHGVDGAIHRAGGPTILQECRALRASDYPNGLPAGQAVWTNAGDLPSKYVVHTVGPMYERNKEDESPALRSCYTASVALAARLGAETVAFPLISSGVYGWPTDDAIVQALAAFRSIRQTSVKTVRLVLFDERTYRLAQRLAANAGL